MFVRPILHILSLPITLITFGLFSFIINALMLKLTSMVLGGQNFAFSSFGSAVLIAVIMSIINSIVADHFSSKYN
ncbi:membrane protein [Vagococcus fluvialis bH819]|uniref:Membrane protein n=2 Tax=Enterococcaceae TaxID=81852 RepID=A0A1X6WQ49_9ENTE|nr:membrane protein [Vagococcus fluvialis bH819]